MPPELGKNFDSQNWFPESGEVILELPAILECLTVENTRKNLSDVQLTAAEGLGELVS